MLHHASPPIDKRRLGVRNWGMTYCVAISVADGLVFASDSRTNAGADQISTYSKMHRFGGDGQRFFTLLSAGNLATTQGVVAGIERDIASRADVNLMNVPDMQAAAEYVGHLTVEEQKKHRGTDDFVPEASFVLGGQVRGAPPRITHIYPEGNFVAASATMPFLQIGEIKYGKPILDRIVGEGASLESALKCALVSMDSTMRSNATVGPPVEYLVYRADTFTPGTHNVLAEDDEYLLGLRRAWSENIRAAFEGLPGLPLAALETARVARIA